MTMPELFILRHGQTEWNAAGRLQGGYDSPLTALGHQQARAQQAILAACDLEGFQVLSSPLGRALETAKIALPGQKIHRRHALREIGIGAWAGVLVSDLPQDARGNPSADGDLALYRSAPGGEGLGALFTRCQRFLQEIDRPSVLVTHGITSRMLRAILLGRGGDDLTDLDGGQGVVFKIKDQVQTKLVFGA